MVEGLKRRDRKYEHLGQPTKYNAELMPQAAQSMCRRGAIMSDIADAFSVSTRTIHKWLNQHDELHDAVQVGVDAFNARVERALAERAIGFWVTIKEEVRDEQGKVIQPEQRRYYPPDPTSIIFFLKNRMRDKWRNVPEYNVNQKTFKTSAEMMIEIRKNILDLQADDA